MNLSRMLVLAVVAALLGACQTANRPPPQTVEITSPRFVSPTYLYQNKTHGDPSRITADIHLPDGYKPGSKYPAVVLSHASGGKGVQTDWWTDALNERGFVVMAFDHFTGRGVTSTVHDQSNPTNEQTIADAFMGLNHLAKHPAVDAKRIGVMGWSKGGIVSLYTAMQGLRDNLAEGNNKFAFHVPMYPYCGFYPQDMRTTGGPILMIVGELDRYTYPAHCRSFKEKLAKIGVTNVELIELAGVGHSFDNPRVIDMPMATFTLQNVWKPQKCTFTERPDGVFVEDISGRPTLTLEDKDAVYRSDLCGAERTEVFYKPQRELVESYRTRVFDFLGPFQNVEARQ